MFNERYTWKEHLRALESFDRPGENWSINLDDEPINEFSSNSIDSDYGTYQNSSAVNNSYPNNNYNTNMDDDFLDTYDYRQRRSDSDVVNIVRRRHNVTFANKSTGIIVGLMFIIIPLFMIIMIIKLPSANDFNNYSEFNEYNYEYVNGLIEECTPSSNGDGFDVTVLVNRNGEEEYHVLQHVDHALETSGSLGFYLSDKGYSLTNPASQISSVSNNGSNIGKYIVIGFLGIFIIVGIIVIVTLIVTLGRRY